MFKIFVIGLSQPILSQNQTELLMRCELIIGTGRFKDLCTPFSAQYLPVSPLDAALQAARKTVKNANVAILASGDPLFFGVGKRVLAECHPDQVEMHPALSAMQLACALFKTPWDDACITTLHGRTYHHIPGLLLQNDKNLIFTDSHNSPDNIARQVLNYLELIGEEDLKANIRVQVAEDLGLKSQQLFSGSLQATAKTRFSTLNILCMIVPRTKSTISHTFGLTEDELSHSRGLITKNEVRAVTLHALQPVTGGILWDIGAGSGSISIEAARLAPHMTVFAIEHKEEGFTNITANIRRFGCYNVVPVFGRAPQALVDLPEPDRVFIGGSTGSMPEIVETISRRIKNNGRLVINGVIKKTIETAPVIMKNNGFRVTSSIVNVTRHDEHNKKDIFNSITIMTGKR
jgi:precorrin-6Y C5,15-methyltransferase (decarboxylating)